MYQCLFKMSIDEIMYACWSRYNLGDKNISDLSNMLMSIELDKRYGIVNSTFLDMHVLHGFKPEMMSWFNYTVKTTLIDTGIILLPM